MGEKCLEECAHHCKDGECIFIDDHLECKGGNKSDPNTVHGMGKVHVSYFTKVQCMGIHTFIDGLNLISMLSPPQQELIDFSPFRHCC